MKIVDVITAPASGAFFYDDQLAIRAGAPKDGFGYSGPPATPGFNAIRMPAAALAVGLVLEDGWVAWGDMVGVQYSGGAGREPVFDPAQARSFLEELLRERLVQRAADNFLTLCDDVLAPTRIGPVPIAAAYGLSQALLRARAHVARITMAEALTIDFGIPLIRRRVPIYGQSGDERYTTVDKMILRAADVLPHGLLNSRDKFGVRGEAFLDYLRWVRDRIRKLGSPDYSPTLHFDVYGWIGLEFGPDPTVIADFMARAADLAQPHPLQIETPADFGSQPAQIEGFAAIIKRLRSAGSAAKVVADEWCNTLEDVEAFLRGGAADVVHIKMPDVGSVKATVLAALRCKEAGVGSFVGGSCTETDLSAQVSVHVAVATGADMMLAKPGMGVDEGFSIVSNEQERLLALLERREERKEPACPEKR